jgi:hypothetical protein
VLSLRLPLHPYALWCLYDHPERRQMMLVYPLLTPQKKSAALADLLKIAIWHFNRLFTTLQGLVYDHVRRKISLRATESI